ncbi:hypothetical protein SAMN05216223_102163 [Actinacidiphila yanglinensis]|uniref:Uncharacterized protein n=1 Tax=Actinacidiphila yanglinensis TaxID=310779 RepID=A0A1H5V5L3_9ACTN|nr:hypothetical protein SAMN05216223_102163 [Actinacidiphila yanglinensis]
MEHVERRGPEGDHGGVRGRDDRGAVRELGAREGTRPGVAAAVPGRPRPPGLDRTDDVLAPRCQANRPWRSAAVLGSRPRSAPCPHGNRSETQCGLVGDGELVGSQGRTTPLLEPIDAPFNGVALLVRLCVEAGRAATGAASPQSVTVLVGGLRDHGADTSPPAMLTDRTGRVRAVCQDGVRPGSRSSWPASRNADACHDRLEGRRVARLSRGGSGGVLVSPTDGGVHRLGPIDGVSTVSRRQERGKDPFPGSGHGPPEQPLVSPLE